MDLVVDTSVVVAALLKSGSTRALIFSPFLKLYSPERLEIEILKNKEKFKEYSNLTDEEFFGALNLLLKQIEIIPIQEYAQKTKEAKELCVARDETDWPFVALALKLNIPIWTSDPDLLKGQKIIPVMKTSDLIKIL